jgi:hypothetical protein
MRHLIQRGSSAIAARLLVGALLSIILVAASAGTSRAMQLIPSLGFTKPTDATAGDGQLSGGLALRTALLPFLSAEGGISYRQESYANGDVRMWPVTASLWLTPVPMLYAGGGVGWYRTSYDFQSATGIADVTTSRAGVPGGGMRSRSPSIGLDLNARYIFMQEDNTVQLPTQFNPDFWSTTVGLAIKF